MSRTRTASVFDLRSSSWTGRSLKWYIRKTTSLYVSDIALVRLEDNTGWALGYGATWIPPNQGWSWSKDVTAYDQCGRLHLQLRGYLDTPVYV